MGFKMFWTYDYDGMTGKYALETKGKSLTLPDQHMSIQQMLIRHAQGLPQTGMRDPVEWTTDPYSVDSDDGFDEETYSDFDSELDVQDAVRQGVIERKKAAEIVAKHKKAKAATAAAAAIPVNTSQTTT